MRAQTCVGVKKRGCCGRAGVVGQSEASERQDPEGSGLKGQGCYGPIVPSGIL